MRRKKIVTAVAAAGILMAVICAGCSLAGRADPGRTAARQTATDEDPEAVPESWSSCRE